MNRVLQCLKIWFISPIFRWALLLGLLVHLLGFLIFSIRSSSLPSVEVEAPFLVFVSDQLVEEDAIFEEQVKMFDSSPLFLPTKWNASYSELELNIESGRELEDLFPEFRPEIDVLGGLGGQIGLIAGAAEITEPVDLLDARFIRFFEYREMADADVNAFEEVTPFAVVSRLDDDSFEPLRLDFEVDRSVAGNALLGPLQLICRVAESGLLIGDPMLVVGSGDAEWDRAVQEILRGLEFVNQLPVGYLSIDVYP